MFVNTGLDFLAREAAAELGPERVLVIERDLRACREMTAALPELVVTHAAAVDAMPGDLVVMPVAKSRRELFLALERLAGMIGPEGTLAVYGDRKEGIGPAQTLLAEHCELAPPVVRAGGRLLLARPKDGTDWGLERGPEHYLAGSRGVELKVAARPGLFSWDELDTGSALLLDACKPREGDHLLDLGCGSGVIASVLLIEGLVARATLCDSDALAVEIAARTLALNGLEAEIVADDAGEGLPDKAYDLILSNPPLHRDFAYERGSCRRMVIQAERLLSPKGRLYMVGPPSLGLGRLMAAIFSETELLVDDTRFQVWRAVKRKLRRQHEQA